MFNNLKEMSKLDEIIKIALVVPYITCKKSYHAQTNTKYLLDIRLNLMGYATKIVLIPILYTSEPTYLDYLFINI